jgi:hypothetical protein
MTMAKKAVPNVRKGKKTGSAVAKKLRQGRRESHGRREAGWFYKVLGGRVPDEGTASPEVRSAAAQIEAWLKAMPAFHRGALSLRYTPKEWPPVIVREFRELSSLAVRLECALHPATGKTNRELEQASVERIEKAIEARNAQIEAIEKATAAQDTTCPKPMPVACVDLVRLDHRAARHVALAIRALGKVRGDASCVLPRAKPDKHATPVTELPPSSSVQWVASDTEHEDAPSSGEVRTWH